MIILVTLCLSIIVFVGFFVVSTNFLIGDFFVTFSGKLQSDIQTSNTYAITQSYYNYYNGDLSGNNDGKCYNGGTYQDNDCFYKNLYGFLPPNKTLNLGEYDIPGGSSFSFSAGESLSGYELIAYSSTNGDLKKYSFGVSGNTDVFASTGRYSLKLKNFSSSWGQYFLSFSGADGVRSLKIEAPSNCPSGFIPVVGNLAFGQQGFCVAKYEMKYVNLSGKVKNTTGGFTIRNWTTIDNQITSKAQDEPIGNISNEDASNACKSMGNGYHLITNNEWMTIARSIESVSGNWSSGIVGSGGIYRGNSNESNTTTSLGCVVVNGSSVLITGSSSDSPNLSSIRGTDCNSKRQLLLSNGQIIWDLAGNLMEQVNGGNSLYGTNGDTFSSNVCSNNNTTGGWNAFSSYDSVSECSFTNGYSLDLLGPKLGGLSTKNGIGIIQNNPSSITGTNFVMMRGGYVGQGLYAGIYSFAPLWTKSQASYILGFRCAYSP